MILLMFCYSYRCKAFIHKTYASLFEYEQVTLHILKLPYLCQYKRLMNLNKTFLIFFNRKVEIFVLNEQCFSFTMKDIRCHIVRIFSWKKIFYFGSW
jgi:hypothetical protein